MTALLRAIERSWFATGSLRDLAMLRIALVAVHLVLLLSPVPLNASPAACLRFQLWLTEISSEHYSPLPLVKIFLIPFGWGARPGVVLIVVVWLIAVAGAAMALSGVRTRLGMLGLAAGNLFLVAHAYSYNESHHTEAVAAIVLLALSLSPSGHTWSADDLFRRLRTAQHTRHFRLLRETDAALFARWPLRLTQWLLALTYLSAALSKVKFGGVDWFNRHTLAHYLARDGIERDLMLGVWLSGYPEILQLLAMIVFVFEATFALAILSSRLAPIYASLGIGIHLSIWAIHGPPFFQTIALYAAFAEPVRQQLMIRNLATGQWMLLYDGLCSLCIRTMVLLDYLDLGDRLRYVDLETTAHGASLPGDISMDAARQRIHLVGPDGRVYAGFAAFRVLSQLLPPLWPILPLLYLPFAGTIGPRVYDYVAQRRTRCVRDGAACAWLTRDSR